MDAPELIAQILSVPSVGQLGNALRTFTRVAADRSAVADAAREVLNQQLPVLLQRVTTSPDTNPEVLEALRLTVELLRPGQGAIAVTSLPPITRTFAPLITAVLLTAAAALEPHGEGSYSPESLHDIARIHRDLAVSFSLIGKLDWSVLAADRVVRARRMLVEQHGNTKLPDLAMALANLAFRLAEVDRHRDAVGAADESIGLFRALVAEHGFQHEAGLAVALVNLSVSLGYLGLRADALAASIEALEIRTKMGDKSLDDKSNLATAWHNIAGDLAHVGKLDRGLEAIENAVRIRRELASESLEHLPDLARSLNNMSARLSALGRDNDALAAIREAVQIWRVLVEGDPDVFLPGLAMSLSNLVVDLNSTGAPIKDSVAATSEVIRIYRTLTADRFEQFGSDLANALQNSALDLVASGRPHQALVAVQEAVSIWRRLADRDTERYAPGLANALNSLAAELTASRRLPESVEAIQEAVGIYRRLVEAQPSGYKSELALALENLSICLRNIDQRKEALAAMEEQIRLRRDLAEAEPDLYLADLASALTTLVDELAYAGRNLESLAVADEVVKIRRTQLGDGKTEFADLALALQDLAIQLQRINRPHDALVVAEEAVHIWRARTHADPTDNLPRLVSAMTTLARVLAALDRSNEARSLFDQLYEDNRTDAWSVGAVLLGRAAWHSQNSNLPAMMIDALQAIDLLDGDLDRQMNARALLQNERRADPDRFDRYWTEIGQDKPIWLQHLRNDAARIELILNWYDISLDDAETFLDSHAETLLTDEVATTLRRLQEEDPGNSRLQQMSEILHVARERGLRAAYAEHRKQLWSQHVQEALDGWLDAPTEEDLRRCLMQWQPRLLSPEADDQLNKRLDRDSLIPDDLWRAGLLTLCRTDGISAAFGLLEDTGGRRRQPGQGGLVAFEPRMLALARIRAGREPDDPEAQFIHSTLALVAGQHHEADYAITQCAENLNTWDRRQWATHLTEVIAVRPDLTEGWVRLRSIMGRSSPR